MSDKKNPRRKNRARKPLTGGKRHSSGCRNHGTCSWCLSNRTHKHRKQIDP